MKVFAAVALSLLVAIASTQHIVLPNVPLITAVLESPLNVVGNTLVNVNSVVGGLVADTGALLLPRDVSTASKNDVGDASECQETLTNSSNLAGTFVKLLGAIVASLKRAQEIISVRKNEAVRELFELVPQSLFDPRTIILSNSAIKSWIGLSAALKNDVGDHGAALTDASNLTGAVVKLLGVIVAGHKRAQEIISVTKNVAVRELFELVPQLIIDLRTIILS